MSVGWGFVVVVAKIGVARDDKFDLFYCQSFANRGRAEEHIVNAERSLLK